MSIDDLKSVFGRSTQERPSPNAIDMAAPPAEPLEDEPEDVMSAQRSELTGLVTVPVFRFNGSTSVPSWNTPEEEIFNWLATAPVEILEERILDGINGVFWGWMRDAGMLKSVLVRFAGIGRDHVMDTWASEYSMENELDLLSREVAAYEVVKALGCEDLALPVAIRDLDTVRLVSDAVRDAIAKEHRIAPNGVDEQMGSAATVQLVPTAMSNFAEYWSELGINHAERWAKASDQLRYSIYRTYFIDFIIGTADRQFSALGYNMDTDRLVMPDMSVSFPHAGYSAQKYMQMRVKGWGRSAGGVTRFVDNTPPSTYDFHNIFNDLDAKFMDEAVMTAGQMSAQLTDEIVARIAITLLEMDIPAECVASLLTRIAYLAFSPGSVMKRPIEYIRNFCVPVRAGMDITDPRISNDIDYVNEIMSSAIGEEFDVMEVLMAPDVDTEFLI